jgi:multiple sugar transport system permease protein
MAISDSLAAGSARSGRKPSGPTRRRKRKQALVAWGFALPFVLSFAIFMVVPLVSSLLMSFTDFKSSDVQDPSGVNFVGLEQFRKLFEDPLFRRSMINTAYFVVAGIPLTLAVSLLLAVALNNGIRRMRSLFRVGFYTPVVTSIVAIAVVWRFILQPDGLLNHLLAVVGISGPNWLNDTRWSMPSMILLAVWRNMGTSMVILLAGLQGIPAEIEEAAMIDGGSARQRFLQITLPLLRPTLLVTAVLLSVGYLQLFEEPFVMTKGGPLNSTLSVTYFTYNQFGFGNYGLAAAASYVLFVAIALLSLVQFRAFRSKD